MQDIETLPLTSVEPHPAPSVSGDPTTSFVLAVVLTVVAAIVLLEFLRRKFAAWARQQILEDPTRRLRPLKWGVGVLGVAAIAFLFDKIDVSRVLDGAATQTDTLFAAILSAVALSYAWGLNFLWNTETAVEREIADLRRDKAIALAHIERMQQDIDNERRLSQLANQITADRWGRLRGLLDHSNPHLDLVALADALSPEQQFSLGIIAIHTFVSKHFLGGLEPEQQLRVAYYEPVDGYLRCIASYDGQRPNCIKNPNDQLRDYFRLIKERSLDCLAVHCSLNGPFEPLMIGDADLAHADPNIPYRHLTESQAEHIRSIAAYCCKRAGGDQAPYAVVTLDCTKRGFFADAPHARLALRRILDEMTLRLAFERDVTRLVDLMRQSGQ